MSSAKKNIIDNCKMLSENGNFLSFVDYKRFSWYLKKNLAEKIDDKTLKLKFPVMEDKIKIIEFAKNPIEKKCVICGAEHNLNKHHVVPSMYRKYLPEEYKKYNSHDVLIVCVDCHENYELYANDLKNKLEKEHFKNYDLNVIKVKNRKINNAKFALLNESLPIDRRLILEKVANQEVIEEKNVANVIVDYYLKDDIVQFIWLWRKHFLDYAKPKFLPKGWSISSPIKFANEFLNNE